MFSVLESIWKCQEWVFEDWLVFGLFLVCLGVVVGRQFTAFKEEKNSRLFSLKLSENFEDGRQLTEGLMIPDFTGVMTNVQWRCGLSFVMELIHLGGEKTVTGSCHLLRRGSISWLTAVCVRAGIGLCRWLSGRCLRIRSTFCFWRMLILIISGVCRSFCAVVSWVR